MHTELKLVFVLVIGIAIISYNAFDDMQESYNKSQESSEQSTF